ncbi:hypothetical protein OIU34_02690 [Pararhizobium sp. BT-229]|uniref:hypothetical protein n=1 Tax=Pararhizobium sp. BT-229 TaxID=2986923 RepID=UPI0021F7346D|nr:hypothetical protein [Pararhizobium sp. BT-229]MCV9960796.1 hypothetical protein [Pararhizobium sp. BT-229]
MNESVVAGKLRELAQISRLGNKHALADRLDEACELLSEAAALINDFPVIIFDRPGQRSIVTATQTSEYAARIGDWTRRRDSFLEKGSKR